MDGHDPEQIQKTIKTIFKATHPQAIIAKTVKGWGVPALQDKSRHGKPLKESILQESVKQLDASQSTIRAGQDHHLHPPKPLK